MGIVSNRITAIGVALLLVVLPSWLCCSMEEKHHCCRNSCAMAPETPRLVAVEPARPWIDVLVGFAAPPSIRVNIARDLALPEIVTATLTPRIDPTIQLRI